MKYFFDTEFLEDGKTIELISIGIVAEDGRSLYLINEEADWHRIVNNQWLRENVIPSLPVSTTPLLADNWRHDKTESQRWRLRSEIAEEVLAFVGPNPEFWAYYADYDWVVLCQLYGRMIDLPNGWPMYCRDLKQLIDERGHAELPKQVGAEHNALDDAAWVKAAYESIFKEQA